MNTISKTISTSAGQVYISHRPGKQTDEEQTVVFLHGWGGDGRIWDSQAKACPLATLTIDLPGFGRSDLPDSELSVSDYADVVEEVIDVCNLKDVILVGHSFGGQVSAAVAYRDPDWLLGLVLVDAACLRSTEPSLLSSVGSVLSPLFTLPGFKQLRPHIYKLIGADQPPENEIMQKTMRQILRTDQREILPEISIPTQIIWGSRDTDTPLKEGEEIAELITRSTLTVLDGGHHIFLDQPTAFTDTLISFIRRIS